MSAVGTFTVVRAARDWRPLLVGLGALAILTVTLGKSQLGFVKFVVFYGPPLLAVTILGGLVEFSQRASVWLIVAQRPGSMARTTWGLLGAGLLVYVAAVGLTVGAGVIGAALNPEVTGSGLWALVVATAAWALIVGAAVAVTSTVARTGTAAASLLWLVSPVLLAFVQRAVGFGDGIRDTIGFILPPLDAVFDLPALLRGELPERAVISTAQLLTFPVLCAGLLGWRIRLLNWPARPRVD